MNTLLLCFTCSCTGCSESPVRLGSGTSDSRRSTHTTQSCGRVDVVVNDAGYAELNNSIADSDPGEMVEGVGCGYVRDVPGGAGLPSAAHQVRRRQDMTVVNVSSLSAYTWVPRYSSYSVRPLRYRRSLSDNDPLFLPDRPRSWRLCVSPS